MSVQKARQGYKLVKWLFGKEIEIPQEWKLVSINDFTLFHKQGFYTNQSYSKTGIRLVRITDLQNPILDYESMPLLELSEKDVSDFKVNKGDFLFARSGAIGRFGIVTKDIPCVFASYIIRFVFDSTKMLNDYFGYFYQTNLVEIQLNAIQQGSSNININAENIKSIKIKLPPIPEQQKIASILSNVDSLIDQTQKIIEQTQRLKKGLMQKLLTEGIGHTKFKKIHVVPRFIDFVVPEEWDVMKLEDISEEIRDGPMGFGLHVYDYVEQGIPILRIQNLKNLTVTKNDLRYISEEKHEELKKSQVKPLDIIISKTGLLGTVGVLPIDYGRANLNQALARITLKNKENVVYVALFLASMIPLQILSIIGSSRTVQAGLKLSDIKNLQVPIPKNNEQQKIVSILSNIDHHLQKQQEYKTHFESLKKGLMQKLLTGRIRVKV